MNLERIELHGFKSFADKTVIALKDGFTAIIGPNGCGKSNVAEAIRWTLGERSAQSLRGKTMTDVIFAGTEKRRSMSYCEVSLVFNNKDQHIFNSLPYDEVSISRKLDRSGLSEYYLNNTRVKLKDIINLLHDTGIGKEGYSIIGQGRIDEILSAKPEDRRNIFEEAAGISKFRAQRVEAENKLAKTADNLARANDVIAEIERHLVPLRRQAETAKKYFELKDALKNKEVNLYIYNYEHNEEIRKNVLDRIEGYKKAFEAKDAAYLGCTAEYEQTIKESSQIDIVAEAQNAELLSLKVDAEKMTGQANVLKEKITHLQADQNRLNGELKEIDAQIVVSESLIKAAEEKKEAGMQSFLKISKEYENANAVFERLSKTVAGSESDLETKNAEYVKALQELGNLRSNSASYIEEKGINQSRLENLMELLRDKKARLDQETTNLSIYDSNLKRSSEKLKALIVENNELLQTKRECQEAIKGLTEDAVSLNSKLGMAEGNLKLQISVKEQYSGFQEAVKRLMQDAKNDPMLRGKILGVLAEVINVPKEYESAIEYALGGNLQNVLVENERDAAALITYLKQKNYGRVTFRPRTACRARDLGSLERSVLSEQGCLGVAADLVSYKPEFDDFVRALIGSTVIVDNMLTAERLWKKYDRAFKIVTLDGEIYARGGEVTGGSRRQQTSGLLTQEAQIEQAKAHLEKLKSNIARLTQERENRQLEIEVCDEKLAQISTEIGELRIETSLNENKAKASADAVEQLTKEIAEDAVECEKVRATVKDLESKLSSIDVLEEVVKNKESEYGTLVAATKSQSGEQKTELETKRAEVMDLRVRLTQAKSDIDVIDAEIFRYKRDMESIQEEKLDKIAEIKTVENQLASIMNAPEKTSFSAEDAKKIKELEEAIASLSERKRAISQKIIDLDKLKTQLQEEKTAISEKRVRDEGVLERIDSENRILQEHVLEEYDLTYTSALEFKDETFEAYGAKTAIQELKKDINRLGDVNTLAVEQLAEQEKHHEEYVTQRDDIQNAYDDINHIIEELTREMTGKFVDAFEKIQVNFKDVFAKLFGGGKGELKLNTAETDDPLEAGIEIYAQPPGKSLRHISLLSGGERAVTAIAILFSILSLKPMPFCVLDEIDAALDESNANLFAEFITKFSDYTQFIVITHRKPTMRHADSIFGVTMEEKGVTKTVAIEFEEAVKHASDGGSDDGSDSAFAMEA